MDFYLPLLWDDLYGYVLAGLVFVVSVRMLRVLGYNKRITMVATVLGRSGTDLLGFSAVFFVIITAYVSAGMVLFNTSMYEFRSVWDSFCTLYIVLLGKNVLGRFIEKAPLWAQTYFISLTIFVILILYTMFQVSAVGLGRIRSHCHSSFSVSDSFQIFFTASDFPLECQIPFAVSAPFFHGIRISSQYQNCLYSIKLPQHYQILFNESDSFHRMEFPSQHQVYPRVSNFLHGTRFPHDIRFSSQ